MQKKSDEKYIYCLHRLKEILKEYESGSFISSLAEISSIVDGLNPEDFAVYGKTICHMLIDIAQHERFNINNIPINSQKRHSYDSIQQLITKSQNSDSNRIIKKQKTIKTSKSVKKRVRKEKNSGHHHNEDSDFADSDSDSEPKFPHYDDENQFNNDHFYSNYKYQTCAKKYRPKNGDHYQNMCSYEISNDYYPTFPQWIPTVDVSKFKKKKRFVNCE